MQRCGLTRDDGIFSTASLISYNNVSILSSMVITMSSIRPLVYIAILFALAACEDAAKTDMPNIPDMPDTLDMPDTPDTPNIPDTQLWQPDFIENYATIKVALRVNPVSYYWYDGKATGFDYQLLQSFANRTQTKIEIIPVSTAAKAIDLLKEQKVDMAAGALGETQIYTEHFAVSQPYYQSEQYMIYRHPDVKPRRFGEISLSDIDVGANPNHIALLEKLSGEHSEESIHADLSIEPDDTNDSPWYLHSDTPSYKLIEMVNLGLIRYALADAHELSATHFLYPYVKIAFRVSEEVPIVWLFNRQPTQASSTHLVHLADGLFSDMQKSGELDRITKSHPGHLELLPYAEKLTFMESAYRKLSKHKRYFQLAADRYHLDWKFLAAVAYQESHWNPSAVSPTGVRGIMMLTKEVAQRYAVQNRSDAYQSIMGGSKYLNELIGRIPSEIPAPDRVWMALAAYLAGYGHLEDAFRLTRERGKTINSWIEVRHSMKLLQKPQWYLNSRHGKPNDNVIIYINNIRNYQFLLGLLEDAISTEIPSSEQPEVIRPM